MVLGLSGCGDDGGVGPGNVRFGWSGSLTFELVTPLKGAQSIGEGELVEILTWRSDGFWSLQQHIAYDGSVGDQTDSTRTVFGSAYSELIYNVNDVEGLRLIDVENFPPDTDSTVVPVQRCTGDNESHLTVAIFDEPRDEVRTWAQCAKGGFGLSTLVTQDARPLPEAARLVSAALLARDQTIGPDYRSAYFGSVPFRSIERGEDSPAEPPAPRSIHSQADWEAFWTDHAGASAAPPVDFSRDQVIVGAVGERSEAGVGVVVRRILQIGDGTLVHLAERIPGDFCSPIARTQYPYHIVVAPKTTEPVRFADIVPEEFSCGG